jgi:chemotaxis signal transduction protein
MNFLTCKVGKLSLAIQLDRVVGVVESGALTPLPYAGDAFEGLVEALGQLMPRVDLALLLGDTQPDNGVLVVVFDSSGSLALRVQQVNSMITANPEQVLASASSARALHPLFMGDILHGDVQYYVLDVDRVAESDLLQVFSPDGQVALAQAFVPSDLTSPEEVAHTPFLLVEIGNETYAFDSSELEELHVPGALRPMLGAPEWVLGLLDLRGKPVVALSAASLLGKEASNTPSVCLLAQLDGGVEVALFVDRALGLERISPDLIYPMAQAMSGIRSYFVRGQDKIVGVISPQSLVEQVRETLPNLIPSNPRSVADKSVEVVEQQHQQLLTVRIGSEFFGLTLDRVERILSSVQLTPLPLHIEFFDGMADVGDGVVPVIDLRKQLERAPQAALESLPPCILVNLDGAIAGLLVDQILNISDVPTEHFEPVKDAAKLPISQVVALNGRMVAVLTIDRLLPATSESGAPVI